MRLCLGCDGHDLEESFINKGIAWYRCLDCGKMRQERVQEVRGSVIRLGGHYVNDRVDIIECASETDLSMTPPFWAEGHYIFPFYPTPEGEAWLKAKQDEIEHRRDFQGPNCCSNPEVQRCDVCKGPSCGEICCLCLEGCLT